MEYTTGDIAELKGCSSAWVYKKARELKLGRLVGPLTIFTEAEKDQLMAIPLGTPGRKPATAAT